MERLKKTKIILIFATIIFSAFIFTLTSFAQELNTFKLNDKGSLTVLGSSGDNNSIYTDNSPSTLMAKSALSSLGYSTVNQRPLVTDDWQFVLTPYIWFAGLTGDISANGQQVDVSASFFDIFDQLDFAFQIHTEAMKDRYFLFVDWTYMKLSIDKDVEPRFPLASDANIDVGVKTNLLDFAGGYRIMAPDTQAPVYLDLYAGGRLWNVDIDLDIDFDNLPSQSNDQSKTWVDLIVGARILALLSENVIFSLKTDIGGFDIGSSSKFSWNIAGNIGYETGWHGVTPFIGWRTLYVDYDSGSGDNFFEYKVWMNGIQTGLGFIF